MWKKWGNLDLNQGPAGYESAALTTELLPRRGVKGSRFNWQNQEKTVYVEIESEYLLFFYQKVEHETNFSDDCCVCPCNGAF